MWKKLSEWLYFGLGWFLTLAAIALPFPYYLLGGWTWINEMTSDTYALYQMMVILMSIALFLAFLPRKWQLTVRPFLTWVLIYFLSLHLMKYGFDKIFKAQFYLPEPNILYSSFGALDKDILFWSTMGLSRPYNIFLGCLELIPAFALLFRRTRLLGVLIAIPVLLHIVVLNFSYDISVKVFSSLLLGVSVFLFLPYGKIVTRFFFQQLPAFFPPHFSLSNRSLYLALKCFAISIILAEALCPYIITKNFNDDEFPRPYLHGAYQVQTENSLNIHRIFIHRRDYLIFQDTAGEMQDFRMNMRTEPQEIRITNYDKKTTSIPFVYQEKDSVLTLFFPTPMDTVRLSARALDWKNLPALQPQFHWTVEEVE